MVNKEALSSFVKSWNLCQGTGSVDRDIEVLNSHLLSIQHGKISM